MREERYRPQFHYTTAKGWINDPIGLVHYRGEYHIFNDHNPFSRRFPGGKTDGEQSHWSHAVSTDLVHWSLRVWRLRSAWETAAPDGH